MASTSASNSRVKPASLPTQSGSNWMTRPSGSFTRGVLTSRKHSCWKKLRCRRRLIWVSCTGCTPATPAAGNRAPATKSPLIGRVFLAASKSTPFTYHGLTIPNAASKSLFCTRIPSPSPYLRPAWQVDARPSRTLRAAARWPMAILDRRPPPCPREGRSGRRDGLFDQTKGWKDNRRQTAKPSARTHSNFKRGGFFDTPIDWNAKPLPIDYSLYDDEGRLMLQEINRKLPLTPDQR